MRNLEMRICKCGRIHFYSTELLNSLLEEDKELVLICSHCGDVTHIGADKEPMQFWDETAGEDEICFNMYSWNEESGEITEDRFNPEIMKEKGKRVIGKVLIDKGISVMMRTGYMANGYQNGRFYDNWYPDFLFNHSPNADLAYFTKQIAEWEEKRKTAIMPALLQQLSDEQAEILSGCCIDGLDWTGTKWANEWNCKKMNT